MSTETGTPSGTRVSLAGCLLSLLLVIFAITGLVLSIQLGLADLRMKKAPDQIRAILADQETAWNAGDLSGFMNAYWNHEGLQFLSGSDVTTGWQATHDRYQKRYQGEGKEMGKLKFEILEVDMLSGDAAVVRGRWGLTKTDASNPHGLFTLLFRRIDGSWVIVSDHTSVASK